MNQSKELELPQSELTRELRDYFPQLSPEDIARFEAHLHERNIADERNGYRLNFVGREYARLQTGLVSDMLISPDTEHNTQPDNAQSGNIFITGDNLEALRHLQNAYAGKVKMIYIDPPYNTGKEFVYKDIFKLSDEKLKTALGYSDEEIARLKSIDGKSSHSAWLTFMYPRLALAKKLLADDGVIFVSIDDNEQANLKLLMDDVFGEGNFVSEIIVNRPSEVATENVIQKHEYLICFAKNEALFKVDSVQKYTISRGTVGNPDQTTPLITFPHGLKCYGIKDGTYHETRKIEGSSENIENFDPIVVKNETLMNDVRMQARWRSSNDMRNFFANECKPTPMGGRNTLLATWLINNGYPFDTKVEEIVFEDYIAHYVGGDSQTLYLIDRGLTTPALKEILNRIGRGELIVSTIVVYPYSVEFEMMRELEIGVKMVDGLKLKKRY